MYVGKYHPSGEKEHFKTYVIESAEIMEALYQELLIRPTEEMQFLCKLKDEWKRKWNINQAISIHHDILSLCFTLV